MAQANRVIIRTPRLNVEILRPDGVQSYWSMTASYKSDDGVIRQYGAIHDTILNELPALKIFAAMHLSGKDGLPLYHKENGWWWYRGWKGIIGDNLHSPTQDVGTCHQYLMDLFRLNHHPSLWELIEQSDWSRQEFEIFADSLRNLWKSQHQKASNLFDVLKAVKP